MENRKNWFQGLTGAELKAEYKRLVKLHHPDMGGEVATMQDINGQYEAAMRGEYSAAEGATAEKTDFHVGREKEMMAALAELIKIPDIEIELIGVWLWITGDTKPHKEELKAAGCRWSREKSAWYWRCAAWKFRRRGKSNKNLDDLRAFWGSNGKYTTGKNSQRKALSA